MVSRAKILNMPPHFTNYRTSISYDLKVVELIFNNTLNKSQIIIQKHDFGQQLLK